jgi:hypothetical protein
MLVMGRLIIDDCGHVMARLCFAALAGVQLFVHTLQMMFALLCCFVFHWLGVAVSHLFEIVVAARCEWSRN